MPAELSRADYHVSSNIGRTIHACRQSVVDARACLDWLETRGHRRLAILGTSLGSCLAFMVAAHDTRIRVAVYNHASMYFGDVVWTGLATAHVRRGLEQALTQDQVRDCWRIISPACYLDRLVGRDLSSLIIWGRYDSSFLPCYTAEVIDGFRSRGLRLETRVLPCGHYTTGQFPFKLMDGLTMCSFVRRRL
jgi:pimeloyl-ACP methyl ester carboxylesterase